MKSDPKVSAKSSLLLAMEQRQQEPRQLLLILAFWHSNVITVPHTHKHLKHVRKLINRKRAPRRPQQCEPNRKRVKIDPDGMIGLEILGLKERTDQNEKSKQEKRMREQILRRDILTETERKIQCRLDIR